MKTTTFLRTLLALTATVSLLTYSSCKKKEGPKPKAVNITYKISSKVTDLKLSNLSISGTNGQDSAITKDLKFPMEIKVRRAAPAKKSAIKIKAKVDKPAKIDLEILVDNKSVKKAEVDIKDITKDGVLEHKF